MQYIKKFLTKDIQLLILIFIIWRFFLFLPIFFAHNLFPLQQNFLGGGIDHYLRNPYFWSLGNFDGEHYIFIARVGYMAHTYFFFPVYPMLIHYLSNLGNRDLATYYSLAMFISSSLFFLTLVGFWKLLALDLKKDQVFQTLLLFLVFPLSFFFAAIYTESTFLFLVVWAFYFARKKNWLVASLLASITSATRVIGIVLLPALLVELWSSKESRKYKIFHTIYLVLIPLGIISYMYFLKTKTGDPLIFIHDVDLYGPQRSSHLIPLPQVFYRYIVKILPSLNFSYFPMTFTTLLELGTGLLFLVLSIVSFFKLRLSYTLFLVGGYLIPTLSGSFSSLPRYVLVLFPGFILLGSFFYRQTKFIKVLFFLLSTILMFVAEALFISGYWVS